MFKVQILQITKNSGEFMGWFIKGCLQPVKEIACSTHTRRLSRHIHVKFIVVVTALKRSKLAQED